MDDFKILKELLSLRENKIIEPDGLRVLFSYLFIAGYLTEDGNGRYKIPNQEIKYAFADNLIEYYSTVYGISYATIDRVTNILQKLFDKDQLGINDEEKFAFIKNIFISEFQPTFTELIQQCLLVSNKCATEGIFANEDVIHSILNFAAMKVSNAFFATEMYVEKIFKKSSAHDDLSDFNLQISEKEKAEGKVRLDIGLKSQDIGLLVEIKHGNRSNVDAVLKQAEKYANAINDKTIQMFVGLHVSANKEVTIAGKICIGNEFRIFNSSSLTSM